MKLTKTKLVAFIGRADYVQIAYADLKGKKNVDVLNFSCFNVYRRICGILHISPISFIYHVLSWLFVLRHLSRKKNNILLFHGVGNLWMTKLPLIEIAKKNYNARIVGIFWDSIDFERHHVAENKGRFDMIIHADTSLVKKYSLEYYPIAFYSRLDIKPYPESCDVFYCGEDGGRLPIMERVYERLTGLGLKCDFYCARSEKAGETINGIKHIVRLTYPEYISHMLSSKIILDILKPGIQGPTLRYCEAVIYDKKVLTNNPIARDLSVYDEKQFFIFDENLQFDMQFLTTELATPNNHKSDLSPMRIVEFICSKFNFE